VAAVIIEERDLGQSKPLILIADTSPFILHYLGGILFQLGNFNVMSATSAQECIDIFRGIKDKVDIIVMDGPIAGDEGVVDVIINVRREKPDQKI
jgi:CheY-like chemotaxis protein